jgi:hypothetical protein
MLWLELFAALMASGLAATADRMLDAARHRADNTPDDDRDGWRDLLLTARVARAIGWLALEVGHGRLVVVERADTEQPTVEVLDPRHLDRLDEPGD